MFATTKKIVKCVNCCKKIKIMPKFLWASQFSQNPTTFKRLLIVFLKFVDELSCTLISAFLQIWSNFVTVHLSACFDTYCTCRVTPLPPNKSSHYYCLRNQNENVKTTQQVNPPSNQLVLLPSWFKLAMEFSVFNNLILTTSIVLSKTFHCCNTTLHVDLVT